MTVIPSLVPMVNAEVWVPGLRFEVGMFPLVLTVLTRDYSTPYQNPN